MEGISKVVAHRSERCDTSPRGLKKPGTMHACDCPQGHVSPCPVGHHNNQGHSPCIHTGKPGLHPSITLFTITHLISSWKHLELEKFQDVYISITYIAIYQVNVISGLVCDSIISNHTLQIVYEFICLIQLSNNYTMIRSISYNHEYNISEL